MDRISLSQILSLWTAWQPERVAIVHEAGRDDVGKVRHKDLRAQRLVTD